MAQEIKTMRLAEVERLLDGYFSKAIIPIMQDTKDYLAKQQVEEMKEYSTSTAGILSMFTSSAMPFNDPYQNLKYTGEWNSKTTEDYLEMCKEKITISKEIQNDYGTISSEWRKAVVDSIGKEKYDELSEKIGCDLSFAYVDFRLQQQMIDKLVKDKMPKSSADFILRKAAQSSLFGLANELQKSELDREIEKRGEAVYNPSKLEKGSAATVGAVVDTISLGGISSWATFAKLLGTDVIITGVANQLDKKIDNQMTVEECISKGVFNTDENMFISIKEDARNIALESNDFIQEINERLNHKIHINPVGFDWRKNNPLLDFPMSYLMESHEREHVYDNIPKVIAPGKEELYLKSIQSETASSNIETKKSEIDEEKEQKPTLPNEQKTIEPDSKIQNTSNEKGWDGVLSGLGLDSFGDVTHNLGYVISMLPDMLVGLFTGKTKSLNIDNSLLPIASIVAGMFIRNPLLKMLLIGLGGVNLLNKVGHEAMEDKKSNSLVNKSEIRYKQYADEPLNKRITNPVLQGSSLIATIDHVPYTIQLPENVVKAYSAGALPLNTLANAILAKNDQMQRLASNNYIQSEQETITRTRGLQ